MEENFLLNLVCALDQSKSKKQINSDIKQLEKVINMLQLTGTFSKTTQNELNSYIAQLSNHLSTIKLKAQIDSKNLKSDVENALHNMSFQDIDALNIDENKTKLKIQKVIADAKAYVEKNPISVGVNIESKKSKIGNDLTSYLNKNTKISESSVLLQEADKVRNLIDAINDKKSLREATDAFQLYKSEVSATGFATKSTTDKIKNMFGHITKLGSIFSATSMVFTNFTKSLSTLKDIDDILTEIGKTSNMTARELEELGNISFKSASKYGKTASDYLTGIQEMSRSGFYGEKGEAMAEQSLLAQAAGDMTADIANKYILATNAAYKYNGEAEKLNAVLDGQNSITNRNSVAMSDMAVAMSEAGTVASSYRVSIEDLSAMIGTMESVTKLGGSEVGNGIKAILINLQNINSSKIVDTLDAANASMTEFVDGTEKLRDPISILRDLADTFNQLDEDDALRAEILTNIGGKHQASKLAALLQNMEMFDKMLVDYSEGAGSAMEEAMKSANNWSGKLNQVQNSWDSLVNSLTSKQTVLGGLTFFDKLIQGAESVVDTLGEIPVVLTTINTAMTAMKKDYGITQLVNPETKKLDVQGNIFGIDLTAIKNQKKHFEEAEEAILHWNDKLSNGKADIDSFNSSLVQNNAQLKEYLATCSKDAPASLKGYRQYLESTGQATEGLRIKTILLNAALTMLGSIAVQAIITGITEALDNYIHRVEKARERTSGLFDEFKEMNNTLSDHKKVVSELADRYDELSKGVNLSNNENIFLSTEEYEEFLDINKQLTQSFPELAKGIDENGNSILTLGTKGITAKEQLEELLQTEEDLNNFKIAQGLDEAFEGVYTYIEEANAASDELNGSINDSSEAMSKLQDIAENGIKLSSENNQLIFSGNIGNQAELNYMNALTASVNEFWKSLDGSRRVELDGLGINGSTLFSFNQDEYSGAFEVYSNAYNLTDEELTKLESIIQDNVSGISGSLLDSISEQSQESQEQIQKGENAWADFIPNLVAGMKSKQTFKNLDSDLQDIAIQIVEGLDYSYATAMNEYDPDPYAYIRDKLIVPMGNLSDSDKEKLKSSFDDLFKLDAGNISQNNQEEITKLIDTIAALLEKDPLEIRVALGFDVEDIQNRYNAALKEAKRQLGGYGHDDRGFEVNNNIGNELDDFWNENVVTEEDLVLWNTVTEGITDATKAMNVYTEAKKNSNTVDIDETPLSFEDAWADSFTSESDSVKELGNTLLGLAEQGRLTKETFEEADSAAGDYFKNLGISADEAVSKINELVDESKQLSSMSSQISAMSDALGTKRDDGFVSADTLSGFDVEVRGLDSWDRFQEVLGSTASSYEECQEAANALATEWVNSSNFLVQLTDENKQYYETQLQAMGIENYDEVITYAQELNSAKEALSQASFDIATATNEEVQALINEGQYSELAQQQIWNLVLAKQAEAGITLNTSADCQNLLALAQNAGVTGDAITLLTQLLEIYNNLAAGTYGTNAQVINAVKNKAESLKNQINDIFANGSSDTVEIDPKIKVSPSTKSSASSAGKETGKTYKEALEEELSDLDSVISGITGRIDDQISTINEQKSYALDAINAEKEALEDQKEALEDAKNVAVEALEVERNARLEVIETQKAQLEEQIKLIDKQIKQKQDEIDAINDAADAKKRENELMLDQYNLERMMHQRPKLVYTESTGMVYRQDTSGIRDAKEAVDDAKRQIEIAAIEKEIDLLEDQKDILNEQIDLLDERADKINEYYDEQIKKTEAFYDEQIKSIDKQIETLEKQREHTEKYFESLIENLEKSKSKYEELTEILEKAELSAKLKQLGIDEEALLNGSEEEFNKLKDAYMGIITQLNSGNDDVLSSLQELSGYNGTAPAVLSDSNSELDEMNSYLDKANENVVSVNGTLSETATNVGNVATSMNELSTNTDGLDSTLSGINTALENIPESVSKINAIAKAFQNLGVSLKNESGENLSDKIDEINDSLNKVPDANAKIDPIATSYKELRSSLINEDGTNVSDSITDINTSLNEIPETGQKVTNLADGYEKLYSSVNKEDGTSISGEISNINTSLNELPESGKVQSLATAFINMANALQNVADALGISVATQGKSIESGIVSSIQALNKISLEKGIIAQFDNLKTAIDSVSSAIGGGGDSESSGDEGQGGNSGSAKGGESGSQGSKGGGNSLTSAITEMGETASAVIGEPEAEGDGTVIGEFGSLKTAVDDVSAAIGSSESEGSEDSQDSESDNLIGSINSLGEQTEEILGDSGGDGVIGRFEEFESVIEEAASHVASISDGLDNIDGKEVECTITVNVKMNGSIPAFASGTVLGNMKIESATYNAQYGKAFASGTIGLKNDEKNALRSEYGQPELTVYPNGTTELTTSPTMGDLPKGTVIYNEEQTKKIMDNNVSAKGNAHANGTVDEGWFTTPDGRKIRPLQPGDEEWDMIQKFNAYMKSIDNNVEKLVPNTMYEQNRQMYEDINQINNSNIVNNNNRNIQPVTVQIGDINLTGVQDVDGLAKAIKTRLPNAMLQQYSITR